MSGEPSASIVIPTRDRPDYLAVTLASVVPQAERAGAEVVVVDDGSDPANAAVAASHRARVIRPDGHGANAARNAGIEASSGDLVVLIDDDVDAPPGWLQALLEGVAGSPEHDVFGGPIEGRLEGGGPRACGRERPPITTLDLGPDDRDVALVWGANMAIRRSALEQIGPFDETLHGRGEEEEWQRRYTAQGGRVLYLAAAGLAHRRSPADSTLCRLGRAQYALGRTARSYDVRKGEAPGLAGELRVLAGCVWHTFRRRCGVGVVMAAHAAGRVRQAIAGRPR